MSIKLQKPGPGLGWLAGWMILIVLPSGAESTRPPESIQASGSRVTAAQSTTTRPAGTHVSRAEQWGLEESEWQRYQSLMKGIRGSVSPATLSPIEVLGIHATSAEERQRYAEQWALMMREDAERILAFQRAYDLAQRHLFPDGLIIDPQVVRSARPDPGRAASQAWQPADRVLVFTELQCPTCDAVLERLLGQLPHFSGIDVYLTDVAAGEESRIRDWAISKQIDPQWVATHKVTLNIDAGVRDRIAAHTGQQTQALPMLVLRRGDRFTPLPPLRF